MFTFGGVQIRLAGGQALINGVLGQWHLKEAGEGAPVEAETSAAEAEAAEGLSNSTAGWELLLGVADMSPPPP